MAKSKRKTTVAALRAVIGLKPKDFGSLIGKSEDWVKGSESGRITLTEENAVLLNHATDVSIDWMMKQTPEGNPINYMGLPITLEMFEKRQAELRDGSLKTLVKNGASELLAESFLWNHFYGELALVLSVARRVCWSAYLSDDSNIALYKLGKEVKQLEQKYGSATSDTILFAHMDELQEWRLNRDVFCYNELRHMDDSKCSDPERKAILEAEIQLTKRVFAEDPIGYREAYARLEKLGGTILLPDIGLAKHIDDAIRQGVELPDAFFDIKQTPKKKAAGSSKKRP